MMTIRTTFHRALTLVEVLIVVAIIGVLAAIVVPVVGNSAESARMAKSQSNLRQVGNAVALYVQESGEYPAGNAPMFTNELSPYLNPVAQTEIEKNKGTGVDESPLRDVVVDGVINRSYSVNPFLHPSMADWPRERVRPEQVQRPSEIISYMDATQRGPESDGCAHIQLLALKNVYMVTPHQVASADAVLPDGPDIDGISLGYFRFRNRGKAYAVHADGSVQAYAKGTLRQRNFSVRYY